MVGIRQPVRHLKRLADLGVVVLIARPWLLAGMSCRQRECMTVSTRLARIDAELQHGAVCLSRFLQSSLRLQLRLGRTFRERLFAGKNAAGLQRHRQWLVVS